MVERRSTSSISLTVRRGRISPYRRNRVDVCTLQYRSHGGSKSRRVLWSLVRLGVDHSRLSKSILSGFGPKFPPRYTTNPPRISGFTPLNRHCNRRLLQYFETRFTPETVHIARYRGVTPTNRSREKLWIRLCVSCYTEAGRMAAEMARPRPRIRPVAGPCVPISAGDSNEMSAYSST